MWKEKKKCEKMWKERVWKRVEEEAIIKNINIVVYCTDCVWYKLCEIVRIIKC